MSRLFQLTLVQRVQALGATCLLLTMGLVANLTLGVWQSHQVAQQELEGLPSAAAWIQLGRLTAEHRGMSASVLAGATDFQSPRRAKQQAVDTALQDALAASASLSSPRLKQLSQGLAQEWQALASGVAGGTLSPKDSFRQHNALIQRQLDALDEVVAASTLALDPESGTYFLVMAVLQRMPQVSDWMGQLRGFGAGMLAKPAFEAQDKAFVALALNNVGQSMAMTQVYVERAAEADPAVAKAMAPLLEKARAQWAQASAVIQNDLLEAASPTLGGGAYFAKVSEAIDAQQALGTAAMGLLSQQLSARSHSGAVLAAVAAVGGAVVVALNLWLVVSMARSIQRSAASAMGMATAMAGGDFSQQADSRGHDEFGQIVQALDQARLAISRAIGDVRHGVDTIATASEQISQGSSDLSQRTEQQASALQQTAASMEELTGTVGQSSDSARQASQLASAASAAAAEGGQVMTRVVGTMDEIAQASQKISNIIGVIDGIAFQTNILALNAAVEAARAGEQGRGFAVVASEVRQLAQRSAEAAREIKAMISASTERVEAGGRLVQTAGRSIGEIVSQVQRMNDLIGEIAAASGEQSKGIAQINEAVNHMDQGTQQNSALAEESAAAAESLREQSERLAQAVGAFRLAASR